MKVVSSYNFSNRSTNRTDQKRFSCINWKKYVFGESRAIFTYQISIFLQLAAQLINNQETMLSHGFRYASQPDKNIQHENDVCQIFPQKLLIEFSFIVLCTLNFICTSSEYGCYMLELKFIYYLISKLICISHYLNYPRFIMTQEYLTHPPSNNACISCMTILLACKILYLQCIMLQ